MKTINYFIFIMALLAIFVACEENELDLNNPIPNEIQKETDILSFADEAEFLALVTNIRNGEANPSSKLRSATSNQSLSFTSLFDEYEQAMKEADDYYQREGGYEEFKQKFPNLYYPEYKDDYTAYLPVSDETIAKLLNKEGKVIISGVERDMRDINSYQQLSELGIGIPDIDDQEEENFVTTRSGMPWVVLTTSKQKINSKRKAWLTLRSGIKDGKTDKNLGRVDLCFRKKGILGWYNGEVSSYGYLIKDETTVTLDHKVDEYSPHKFIVFSADDDELNILKNNKFDPVEFRVVFDYTGYGFVGTYDLDMQSLAKLENGLGFIENWRNWYVTQVAVDVLVTVAGTALVVGILALGVILGL